MSLDEAITIARKCLHCSEEVLSKEGIDYIVKCEAYDKIAKYHSKISLLENNNGATEQVLAALQGVKQ
ncbi:hypothetical protein NVP1101O_056 [Vibrio phage 1.101.O._10N.261.45.C6]|nr:hypothetical protein NVP1101O_056 [Vibrio phage 1.101.O._10N.261.45.C6]